MRTSGQITKANTTEFIVKLQEAGIKPDSCNTHISAVNAYFIRGIVGQQRTPEFRADYTARAGIEGIHSQGARRCDLRQACYVGRIKTHL